MGNNISFEKYIEYKKDSTGKVISPFSNGKIDFTGTEFINYSIFNTSFKEEKNSIKCLLTNDIEPNKLNQLESGSMGTMLGMAIADAMGHRYEFKPVVYDTITLTDMGTGEGGVFKLLPGQWTDDTSMGLCIADSLLVKKGNFDAHDLMHRFLCWWYGGYNNAFRFNGPEARKTSVGLGGTISQSFKNYIDSPTDKTESGNSNSSGIGSIMRNAAVPICYHNDMEMAMKVSELQSYLTHQGIEAAECCRLLTFIIIKILNRKNENLKEILNNLNDFETNVESVKCLSQSLKENNDENRDWNWKNENFRYSPLRSRQNPGYIGSYAMDGMAMALHVVYYTNNFKEAIIKVVNLRGDADSVGAVVGQIAGAYYGVENIPTEWIKIVSKWDDFEIPLRGYLLLKINDKAT